MKQFFVAIWLLGCGPPGPEPEPPKEPLIGAPIEPNAPNTVPAPSQLALGMGQPVVRWPTTGGAPSGDLARKSATLRSDAVSICPTKLHHPVTKAGK